MRLVSINSWKAEGDYPRRIDAMAEALAALAPDVVAIQEDFCTGDGNTHTAKALSHALSMHLSCVPARLKHRLFDGQQVLSTSGVAILSREAILEHHALALPEDTRDGERVAQLVKMRGSEGDWWLANLHLTHLADRSDLRQAQLAAILRRADELRANAPWVLCGDFNAEPDSPELAGFLSPTGSLTDVFSGMPKKTLVGASDAVNNLDHILLHIKDPSRSIVARGACLALDHPGQNGVMPSDHCAVCVDLF